MASISISGDKIQVWTGVLTVLSALCAVFFFWVNWLGANYASKDDTDRLKAEIAYLKRDLTLQMIEMRLTENDNSIYEFEKMLRDIDVDLSPRDKRQYQQLLANKKELLTQRMNLLKITGNYAEL